jgi:hypothetical protein
MKKCPPGVICVENVTMFFAILCIAIVTYLGYANLFRSGPIINNHQREKIIIREQPDPVFNYSYNNDVLTNPYVAPLRDERYMVRTMPINVPTNAIDTTYRQVGILTPLNGHEKNNILPLMGRLLVNRRDLWNYYTISNQHNNVKLPLSVKGKSALSDIGVDRVYNGDTVYVEGANEAYKVTIYDNDTIRYLPF